MKKIALWLVLLVVVPIHASHAGEVLFSSMQYQGRDDGPAPAAGKYRNPILAGFYPDPSVVRVGDDFYLVNSTFGYFPGLPVFHSRDLVHWTQIGNAIDRPEQIDFGHAELNRGLFAASISHHAGRYYIVNTCFYCGGGNFVITAGNPAGPWSKPVWLKAEGIDPSLFFDDDGKAWLVRNGMPEGKARYEGHRAIWLQEFDPTAMTLVGPSRVLVDSGADLEPNPQHVEGPHVFRHDGWYYLIAAQGGTGDRHAEMVWRSRAVTGPYAAWSGNPILTQRDLNPDRPHPITSTGHAQFVELKDGSWWAVFLGTRPYRNEEYLLGRETFLLPVHWQDGWPQVLPHGAPVPHVLARPALADAPSSSPMTGSLSWTERFTGNQLPQTWMTINVPRTPWFSTGAKGLRMTPSSTPLGDYASGQPAYVAHRLQHHKATIDLALDPRDLAAGERAGLALFQNETHYYAAVREQDASGTAVVLYRRNGKDDPPAGVAIARATLRDSHTTIRLRFQLNDARLDVYHAESSREWKPLTTGVDASLLSVVKASGFTGVTFGPYAYAAR